MKPFFHALRDIPQPLRILLPVFVIPALGAFVGIATQHGVEGWYKTLDKPFFTPPDWVFGVAWTMLYVLMGISFGLLWRKESGIPRLILILFALQLALNLVWSYLFFQFHWLWISTFWICGLIGLVGFLVYKIWSYHRLSSVLLWPYLGWLIFALTLNFGIVHLNG